MPKRVNVLAIARLKDEELATIRAVDSRLSVACSVDREETDRLLPDAEVLVASWRLDLDLAKAPQLKWVHVIAAGLDHFFRCRHCGHQVVWDGERLSGRYPCDDPLGHQLPADLHRDDIVITNSAGSAVIAISEYVMAMMLALTRRLPRLLSAQAEHRWLKQSEFISGEVNGTTLGIIGMGHIGARIAELARPFGIRVLAIRRSVTTRIQGLEAAPADEVFPAGELEGLLSASDFVVLSLPLTPETEDFFSRQHFHAMKRSAVLVNVSRGRVVDQAALVEALRGGLIGGAILDVVAPEPLEPASPLWDLPDVLITPHVSAVTYPYSRRAIDLFCDNLRRYLSAQPLLNVFDPRRGY